MVAFLTAELSHPPSHPEKPVCPRVPSVPWKPNIVMLTEHGLEGNHPTRSGAKTRNNMVIQSENERQFTHKYQITKNTPTSTALNQY